REAVQPVIGNDVGNVEDPVSAARHDAIGDAIGVADAGSEEGGRHVQVLARDVAGGQEPQPAPGAEGRQLGYGSFRVVGLGLSLHGVGDTEVDTGVAPIEAVGG